MVNERISYKICNSSKENLTFSLAFTLSKSSKRVKKHLQLNLSNIYRNKHSKRLQWKSHISLKVKRDKEMGYTASTTVLLSLLT